MYTYLHITYRLCSHSADPVILTLFADLVSSEMTSNRADLPPHIEKARSRVTVELKKPLNASGTYAASAYSSLTYDNSLKANQFLNSCRLRIRHSERDQILFDIVQIDAPLANAIRRILLVEIPTFAIEHVFVHTNTSIMHDEQLAHRLGLVPLLIDPHSFRTWKQNDHVTEDNTIKFRLNVECRKRSDAPRDEEATPDLLYVKHNVFSEQMKYIPMTGQDLLLKGVIPRPVHDDILLCKLRPGQAIDVEMHATKNIGREHAKWSPVCTASYRMLPEVTILEQPVEEIAHRLRKLCPTNVFDIEDEALRVARSMECTMCRECIREEPFSRFIELTRRRDHFVFDVESTGALQASVLVVDALKIMMGKCGTLLTGLDTVLKQRRRQ